jgi:hypothetical protein
MNNVKKCIVVIIVLIISVVCAETSEIDATIAINKNIEIEKVKKQMEILTSQIETIIKEKEKSKVKIIELEQGRDTIKIVTILISSLAFMFTVVVTVTSIKGYIELKTIKEDYEKSYKNYKEVYESKLGVLSDQTRVKLEKYSSKFTLMSNISEEMLTEVQKQMEQIYKTVDKSDKNTSNIRRIEYEADHNRIIDRIKIFRVLLLKISGIIKNSKNHNEIEKLLNQWYLEEVKSLEKFDRLKNLYSPINEDRKNAVAYFSEKREKGREILHELESLKIREENEVIKELVIAAIAIIKSADEDNQNKS